MYEAKTILHTAPHSAQRAHAVERFIKATGYKDDTYSDHVELLINYIKANRYTELEDVELDLKELLYFMGVSQ